MRIVLDLTKSVQQNAQVYFEASKKAKKKIPGAEAAIAQLKKKLESVQVKAAPKKEARKKEWFEKFKWFVSSDGFLVIGGRDATTNDIIVKKHAEKGDIVFHTELPGSPFVIIKSEGKPIPQKTLDESAIFCASHSRSWSEGRTIADVYCVSPDQVKKELGLPKGTFMIHGKRTYFKPQLGLAAGIYENKIMIAPEAAVKKHCEKQLKVMLGSDKKSDVAKKIRKLIGGELDEIMQALPPGEAKIMTE